MRKLIITALCLITACTPLPKEVAAPEQCAKDAVAKFITEHPNTQVFWYVKDTPPRLTDYLDQTAVTPEEAEHLLMVTALLEKCYAPVFDDSDINVYFGDTVKRCRAGLVGRAGVTNAYIKGRVSRGEYLSRIYRFEWPLHLCTEIPDHPGDVPPAKSGDDDADSDEAN
jgi:hypothetical protein